MQVVGDNICERARFYHEKEEEEENRRFSSSRWKKIGDIVCGVYYIQVYDLAIGGVSAEER